MRLLSRAQRFTGPAILLLAALIAVGPLLWRGPACGSDLGFHFISWIDAEHRMSMGTLYPHWANNPNFGAGDPRFVFYPPITWMAGAVLGMLLPWSFVPLVLFILLLAATGMANRALAREVMADGPATLAGCAAIFLGYSLFNVYKRSDFAELAGGFLIPLLLLFALRRRNPSGNFWQRAFDGSAAPLALVVAAIWLSNGPVGIMAGYLLAAVALVSALMERSLAPMVRAAVSTFAGMGLAALYLIPAVWEKKWASIQYAVTLSHFVVESSWLFAHHAGPDMVSHDMLLHRVSKVAVAMLAIAIGGGVVAWICGVMPGERKWWLPLALIPFAVLFLLLPISEPVWNSVPELRLLQFPWRWLVVLEAPMAIGFASAVWFDRRTPRILTIAACAAVFVGISLAAAHWWFVECNSVEASLQESVRQGIGVPGKPEYSPPGVRFALMDRIVHSACLLNSPLDASDQAVAGSAPAWDGEAASCDNAGWSELVLIADPSHPQAANYSPEQKRFAGIAGHAGYLILRLRYYPAWEVRVNGNPVTATFERERGLMAVPVPKGNVRVSVDWTTTTDVIVGRWVSVVALLLIAGLYLFERKYSPAHFNLDRASSSVSTGEARSLKVEPKHPTPSQQTDHRNTPTAKSHKTDKQKSARKSRRGGGSK